MINPLFLSPQPTPAALQALFLARAPIFLVERPVCVEPVQPEPVVLPTQFPRRKKDGSLKHICLKLLNEYADKTEVEIHLNEFSAKTGVERRRIYDIVNILEGFDVFVKKAKNVYVWKGLDVFMRKRRGREAHEGRQQREL